MMKIATFFRVFLATCVNFIDYPEHSSIRKRTNLSCHFLSLLLMFLHDIALKLGALLNNNKHMNNGRGNRSVRIIKYCAIKAIIHPKYV